MADARRTVGLIGLPIPEEEDVDLFLSPRHFGGSTPSAATTRDRLHSAASSGKSQSLQINSKTADLGFPKDGAEGTFSKDAERAGSADTFRGSSSGSRDAEVPPRSINRSCHVLMLLISCAEFGAAIWVTTYINDKAVSRVLDAQRMQLTVTSYATSLFLIGAIILAAGLIGTFRPSEVSRETFGKGNVVFVHRISLIVATGLLLVLLMGSALGLSDISGQLLANGREKARTMLIVVTAISSVALFSVLAIIVAFSTRLCFRRE